MIVLDSSTLILLAKASVLETVAAEGDMLIPECVYEESVIRGKEKARPDSLIIEKLVSTGKIKVLGAPAEEKEKLKKSFGITCGENQTVALAISEKCRLVLTDDRKSMTVCRTLGIPYMIALDALIDLYYSNRITPKKAEEAFNSITETGWLSEEIIKTRRDLLKKKVK
jgi:predicted nucleic acid-binding protein